MVWEVRRPEDLITKIIPHFQSFPLQSKKGRDYVVWKKIVLFVAEELLGKKGRLRRFPEKVDEVQRLCANLRTGRSFDATMHGGN